MSLTYVFLSQLGNSIGAMSLPTVTGNLVATDPVWMGWMVLIVSVGCIIFEGLIYLQGNRVQRKYAHMHENEGASSDRHSTLSHNEIALENPAYEK